MTLKTEHVIYQADLVGFTFHFHLDQADDQWLPYSLELKIREQNLEFHSQNKQAQTYTGGLGEIGKFAFGLNPINELEQLIQGLQKLVQGQISSFRFEPLDPSFELELQPSRIEGEYKLYFWVDAGNTSQLEYSWDAIGLRLLTNKEEIQAFIEKIRAIPEIPQIN